MMLIILIDNTGTGLVILLPCIQYATSALIKQIGFISSFLTKFGCQVDWNGFVMAPYLDNKMADKVCSI